MQLAPFVFALLASSAAAQSSSSDSAAAQSSSSDSAAAQSSSSDSAAVSTSDNSTSARSARRCRYPSQYGVKSWYYNSRSDGPYDCKVESNGAWTMLTAYRSGGTEGVHWKYTDNEDDPTCMKYWKYYSPDGNTLWDVVSYSTTFSHDTRRWCALPVYRSGGVEYNQWGRCTCD